MSPKSEPNLKLKLSSESKQKQRLATRASMRKLRAAFDTNDGLGWMLLLGFLVSSATATSNVHNQSANNRGGWPRNFGDLERSASIFGQRTKTLERRQDVVAEKSPIVWSQPDPRKSYSLPLTVALHTRRQKVTTNSYQQSKKPERQNKFPQASNDLLGQLNQSASLTNKPTMEANRRNAAGETVTLIRYVPLLMQLPAEQLLQLASSPTSLQQRQIKQPDLEPSYLLTTPPTNQHLMAAAPTYAYTPPITHNHNQAPLPEAPPPVYEYQQDAVPYLVSGYSTPGDLLLGPNPAAAPLRLAYLPASALQPPSSLSTMSGKALSAYASRLISMLRPSALLSSFGGQQQQHQQQQQHPLHNQLAQGPFILLTPTTTAAVSSLPNERPRPVTKFQKPMMQELLLDQASFRSSASRLQPAWAHQRPNGLICVHSLPALPANQQLLANDEQQQQQLDYVAGNDLGKDDDDGFSPPATTKSPPSHKSSSAKLSAKASAKSPKSAAQLVAVQDQQLKPNSSSSANLRDEHGRRLGASEHQSIIPFTIKDKIEAPRQLMQLRNNRQKHQQQSSYSSSSGVQFDEPVDTPDEELAGRGGRGPSKTSFSATTTLKPPSLGHKSKKQSNNREPVHSAIVYSRELGAQAGSLPLLIASSNRNRGSNGGAHNGPLAATTMSSSTAPAAATTEMTAAAATSSQVSSLGNSTPTANNISTIVVGPGSGPAERGEIGPEEAGHSYSNNRLLSNMDNSMEEFARMSEQLQTNPMDLIDLQNARSNFELPAQLESLSMLYNSQQVAPSSVGTSDSDESDKQQQRTQLGQLRWTTATTPASLVVGAKQRQARKKSRS